MPEVILGVGLCLNSGMVGDGAGTCMCVVILEEGLCWRLS